MSLEDSAPRFCLIPLLFSILSLAAAQSGNWTQQMPATSPSPRNQHALAYDSAHSDVVLFGGSNGNPNLAGLGDTWTWNGTNWTQASPQTKPPARYSHAMAYDAMHQQTVLFGGEAPALLNDTWVWNNTNWTEMAPAQSPPVRYGHALAYDSAHNQVVLFGGQSTVVALLNDTWLWDGANWTQKSPQHTPPARYFHSMAYDSTHGKVVLFGGADTNGNLFGDTWLWDGADWTQETPQTSPSARWAHATTFDSVHGQLVLFGGVVGGVGNGTPTSDTWIWDGTDWTKEAPQSSPQARSTPAMAYDSMHDQVVLFGGYAGGYVADTWTWSGSSNSSSPPTVGAVVSASAFGGFASVAPGSWVEIYGSNLAPDTRPWAGSDFTGNNAPTSLDGVSVTIGGQSAFVDYISAGQVNAQLPSNIATGSPLQLTVTNGGVTSAPMNVMVNAIQPGLLAPASFKVGANQYVVAQHSDGAYVLPAGAISGINSRPAQPAETLVIYGVGFGKVTPDFPAGEIVTGDNQLALPFQLNFGQTPAQLSYDGLSPNYVGLYQFNVVVPAVPDSDLVPLTFNLGGTAGTQTLYIAVHQ